MSRSQQGQVFQTATDQNTNYNKNATTSYDAAQKDIGAYSGELSKYAAENPYGPGGAYATAQNQQIGNAAAGEAEAAGQALQSSAVRTGQNPGGAIAATEKIAEDLDRQRVGQQGAANQDRIAKQADYNQTVLGATAVPVGMQSTLAGQQGQLGQGALNTTEQAAQTPSFMDELGEGLIKSGENVASAVKFCWIAAELYGGWSDERVFMIREWLNEYFEFTRVGRYVVALYRRFGERLARLIRRYRWLRWPFQKLFDAALERAARWRAQKVRFDAFLMDIRTLEENDGRR